VVGEDIKNSNPHTDTPGCVNGYVGPSNTPEHTVVSVSVTSLKLISSDITHYSHHKILWKTDVHL